MKIFRNYYIIFIEILGKILCQFCRLNVKNKL